MPADTSWSATADHCRHCLFPNVALAGDGGVSLDPYASVRIWQRAIRSLDGFIEMPGIHRLHELSPAPHPSEA